MRFIAIIPLILAVTGCVTVNDRTNPRAAGSPSPSAAAAKPAGVPQKECAVSTEYVARYGMEKAKKKLMACEKENAAAARRAGAPVKNAAAPRAEKPKAAAAKPKQECAISTMYVARVGFERAKKELEACERQNR